MSENYLEKWLKGELSEQERKEFEATPEFESLKKLSSSINKFKAPEYNKEVEWDRLSNDIYHNQNGNKKDQNVIHWLTPYFKVAAAIVILATTYIYFFSDNVTTISTSFAEKKTVILPDSSIVILNALSSITFNEDNWNNEREVKMDGEALYKVKKGSDFRVMTLTGSVKVLGTQFNVRERNSLFEVICYEGAVQVTKDDKQVELRPNQIFKSLKGISTVDKKEFALTPHLESNESAFYSSPVSEVLNEFQRQYQVNISAKNIDLDQDFTGRFTHENMDLALRSITVPLDLSFEIKSNKRIVLSKK